MIKFYKSALGGTVAASVALILASSASAEDAPAPAALPTLALPLAGPLVANPSPLNFEVPILGKVYVTGVASGLARFQNNSVPGDHDARADISNGQVFIQKADGVVQFFVQAGIYSLPSLGAGYVRATTVTDATYGPVPQAWLKIAPSANFSVQIGKLPTLQGAEYTFTFQNMNVDRGLLWNQENAVNKGIQANLTAGKLAVSVSLNDGYYSSKYNWLSGLVTYTFDPANVIAFVGSGSTSYSGRASFRTPFFQNSGQLYNIIYTHTSGNWLVQPYLQYTHIPALRQVGSTAASTYAGAILARYAVSPNFSLPARVEYIATSGRVGSTAPNLLYGQGSRAFSITLTPTYTYKLFFARLEASYVRASSITGGAAFDDAGTKRSQLRGLLEAGVIF